MTDLMRNKMPKCSGDDCGTPMFESMGFLLCPACDMITPEEIDERKALAKKPEDT